MSNVPTPWEMAGSPEGLYGTQPDHEDAFMAGLESESPRVSLSEIGHTVEGRAIRVMRIGVTAGNPLDPHPRSALLLGGQHGNEVSAPEALFRLARNLSDTTDPALVDYLTKTPILIIPNLNRDGTAMIQALNANGINLNRDHLSMREPETKALWSAISMINPQMLVDMHTGGVHTVDVEPSRFIGVDKGLREAGIDGVESIRTYLASQGITTGPLTVNEWDPRTLRNMAGLAGMVGFLSETYGGNNMSTRSNADYHAAMGALYWHHQSSERVTATQAAASMRATRLGDEAEQPYWIGAVHTRESMSISPPPTSYILTPQKWEELATQREAFGINGVTGAGSVSVNMGQPAYPVIPMLMDKHSNEAVVHGRRIGRAPEGDPTNWGPIKVEGREHPVTSVDYVRDGQLRRIWP